MKMLDLFLEIKVCGISANFIKFLILVKKFKKNIFFHQISP
jgi:hypothetical protein